MSKIDLLLDEENELTFQINIEGNAPGSARCRLRLENKDVGLLFEANAHEKGEVSVVLPPLAHVLKEGDYDMTLEVVVDDKFFEPLTLQGSFEKSVKVTAESIVRKPARKRTNVTASVMTEDRAPTITVRNSKTQNRKTQNSKTTSEKRVITGKDIESILNAIKRS